VPRRPVREGERTIALSCRLEESTVEMLRAIAERKDMLPSELMRSVLRSFAYTDQERRTTTTRDRAYRSRRQQRRVRTEVLPPVTVDPIGYLAGLREPARAVHDYAAAVDGPPRCVRCGSCPWEEAECL
jgi:hypothetical protein